MARRSDPSRAAFWRQLIERRRHVGLSVARVCEQAGVSPASFYQWQRKLRGAAAPTRNVQADLPAASRLVPVHIVADPPIGRADTASMLEVELPGEIRVRIPAGCDPATLQVVMSMLLRGDRQEGGSC